MLFIRDTFTALHITVARFINSSFAPGRSSSIRRFKIAHMFSVISDAMIYPPSKVQTAFEQLALPMKVLALCGALVRR
jgi:hypothetical protein